VTTDVHAGLHLQGLTKYYGLQRGVENISFDVQPGEVVGFVGPNGSGKTTVMRMLTGLIHITRGSAFVLGTPVTNAPPSIRANIGYLPGTLGLYKNQTVREYLEFMSQMRGIDCTAQINSLAKRLALNTNSLISGLSKGTKQKVGVIQAFMHNPRVLILDEPTSGLDPIVQREFEAILLEARDNGAAVLLSSHLMHEVEQLASRVAIINQGHLLVIDDVHSLKARISRIVSFDFPQQVSTERFTFCPGVEHVTRDGNTVECHIVGPETELLRVAVDLGAISVTSKEPSLEDIFMSETENDDVS
jgi:ABC-2 type transport system ATP-binding protein